MFWFDNFNKSPSSLGIKKSLKYQLILLFCAVLFFVAAIEMQAFSSDVVIKRILYNPDGSDNKTDESSYEFVELENISDRSADVSSWEIRGGTYFSLSKIVAPIPPEGRVIVYMGVGTDKNLDFSSGNVACLYENKTGSQLGDSHGDVSLYKSHSHSKDTIVDYMAYGAISDSANYAQALAANLWKADDFTPVLLEGCVIESKENRNYNSSDWESNCTTTEQKTISINDSDVKLSLNDDVYVNVYAYFEIIGLSKNTKVTWTFGDNHRSYLQKTRHKYENVGKYEASVKYSDGSKDVVKNFTVEVGEVPHPKVKIISVNANPKGSDTDNESITLQNKSKKKINFKGWSVATGWKKMINHPINEDFKIKAGKTRELTREFSKFTLNNSKNKIELRYPDGGVAYKLKYKKEKKEGIAEGEIYEKVKGGWAWQSPVASIKYNVSSINTKNAEIINQETEENSQESVGENKKEEIVKQDVEIQVKKKTMPVLLVQNDNYVGKVVLDYNAPQVLGAETVREIDDQYLFTPEFQEQEHYAIVFAKNIFMLINSAINSTINNLFSQL